MGLAAELVDGVDVISRRDEAFGQLGDPAQLVARSMQVSLAHAGGESEILHLAHGVQDITSLCSDLMNGQTVGLCATCRWVRIATNRRGSLFYRCLRADMDPPDPRFVRYPLLPVLECPGYDRRGDQGPLAEPERDRDER